MFAIGGYYMRTSAYLTGKGRAVLKSIILQATMTSRTVSFYYFVDCINRCTASTLTLSCELTDGTVVTVWTVRNIHVYNYLPARAHLHPATRRLIFTLAGQRTSCGIDDVTLSDDDTVSNGW